MIMSSSTEYLIALAALIVITFYFYYKNVYRKQQFFKQIPSPPASWFLGHAKDFTSNSAVLKNFHKYTKEYGSMVHVKLGPFGDSLLTSDYNFLKFLLSSNKLLKKSKNLRYLKPWLGEGLATVDGGPEWKMHRKMITPAFHFKILEQFVDIFESGGDSLVDKLSKVSGSSSVDIYTYMTRCTFDIICGTAMGTKASAQDMTNSYFESIKEMCRIFIVRTVGVFMRYDIIFRLSKDYKIQKKAVKLIDNYCNKMIDAKRKELKGKQDNCSSIDELGRKTKKVFLDLILESSADGQIFSQKEIRDEVNTFLFGGHDTTATASSFILYCIANNKDVQQKIIEEQQYLFGNDKNPTITYANLQEMKYLENVIKEGLRLYSPVPIYGRQIDQDVKYNGMLIPKGVGVVIFSHGLHMNPEYYPNPEKFDPSRFDDLEKKHPFAFIPFSAGPRNCIGQRYAMLEIKSLISKIVRNFELFPASPKHEMELVPETVLKSLNGVKIGLSLR